MVTAPGTEAVNGSLSTKASTGGGKGKLMHIHILTHPEIYTYLVGGHWCPIYICSSISVAGVTVHVHNCSYIFQSCHFYPPPPIPQDLAKCESEMQAWEQAFMKSKTWFEEYVSEADISQISYMFGGMTNVLNVCKPVWNAEFE